MFFLHDCHQGCVDHQKGSHVILHQKGFIWGGELWGGHGGGEGLQASMCSYGKPCSSLGKSKERKFFYRGEEEVAGGGAVITIEFFL